MRHRASRAGSEISWARCGVILVGWWPVVCDRVVRARRSGGPWLPLASPLLGLPASTESVFPSKPTIAICGWLTVNVCEVNVALSGGFEFSARIAS